MDRPKIVSLKDPALAPLDVPELPPVEGPSVPSLPQEKPEPALPASGPVEPLKPPSVSSELPKPSESSTPTAKASANSTEALTPVPVAPPAPEVPPLVPEPQKIPASGAPPWVEREKIQPPEREDELARELSAPRVVSVQTPKIVRAYQDQAARDMLPPQAGPQPLSMETERDRARRLAQEIHQKTQSEGVFGRLKRALGMR